MLLKCLLTAGDDGAGSDFVHGRLGHKSTGEVEQGDKRQEDAEGLHSWLGVCGVWTGAACRVGRVCVENEEKAGLGWLSRWPGNMVRKDARGPSKLGGGRRPGQGLGGPASSLGSSPAHPGIPPSSSGPPPVGVGKGNAVGSGFAHV